MNRLGLIVLFTALSCILPVMAQSVAQKESPFTIEKELSRLPSVSQGRTGTCWAFATTSFLESEVERLTGSKVDLSEIYIVRHSILEKARRYLAAKGKATLGEGGLSHDVIYIAKSYGLAPLEAYNGLEDGASNHDHAEMWRLIDAFMKELTKERGSKPSPKWERALLALVDTYLGTPPTTFTVGGTLMTPADYTKKTLGLPLDDYVEVMAYSSAPFGSKAKLEVPDNWLGFSAYENLPIDNFMATIDQALARGITVAVDIDVSEPGFRSNRGVAELVPAEREQKGAVTQEVRDAMFADKSTTDDHLMHIVGTARHTDGRRFYLTKDSGGTNRGPYAGHTLISENYLRAKALGIMVHKDALAPAR